MTNNILQEQSFINQNSGSHAITPSKAIKMVDDSYASKTGYALLVEYPYDTKNGNTWALPLPNELINYSQNWSWEGHNINPYMSLIATRDDFKDIGAIGSAVWSEVKRKFELIKNLNDSRVMQQNDKKILNPNEQTLFFGPGLSDFELSFKLIPFERITTANIKQGIQELYKGGTPGLSDEISDGRSKQKFYTYMNLPSLFTIQILRYVNGQDVCLMSRSLFALTNATLSMTPNSFHNDGSIIEYNLTLSCSETIIIDRAKREQFNNMSNIGIIGDLNQ